MKADYIFVKSWQTKKGATGQTAYALPKYDEKATAEELIASSTAACHVSLVDVSGMKKKRFIGESGESVVYGVN